MIATLACASSSYVMPSAARPAVAPRASTPTALAMPFDIPFSLIAELVDADGERIYGAVDAPSWVAPVAGIAAIGTALLPV